MSNGITFATITLLGGNPSGLFVDINNTVYAANKDSSRIHVWREGQSVPSRNYTLPLSYPKAIFATINGDIFFDAGNTLRRVERLASNMSNSTAVMTVTHECYGIFVDVTNVLYCSMYHMHRVMAISLTSTLDTWITAAGTDCLGSGSNQLYYPLGIFVDTNLDLYIADCGNDRIQVYSADRVVARTVSIAGPTSTWTLDCPSSVILDGDGYLFIADSYNNRILGSGPNGFRCIIGCGDTGAGSNQLDDPFAINFDTYGNLFVLDRNNHRIQKFNLIPNTSTRK